MASKDGIVHQITAAIRDYEDTPYIVCACGKKFFLHDSEAAEQHIREQNNEPI